MKSILLPPTVTISPIYCLYPCTTAFLKYCASALTQTSALKSIWHILSCSWWREYSEAMVCVQMQLQADFVPWKSLSFNVIKIVPAALLGKYVMKSAPRADLYISPNMCLQGANLVFLNRYGIRSYQHPPLPDRYIALGL